jgi:hypothetical protein
MMMLLTYWKYSLQHLSMAKIHRVASPGWTSGGTEDEHSSRVWLTAYLLPRSQHSCVISDISSAMPPENIK